MSISQVCPSKEERPSCLAKESFIETFVRKAIKPVVDAMKDLNMMYSLNEDLMDLVEVKNRVDSLSKKSVEYDSIRRLFDKISEYFNVKYGVTMEQIMFEIYDDLCPDDEVRPIEEYLASHYEESDAGYEVGVDAGVAVHLDDFSFKEGRLILLPSPARIVLQDPASSQREILWQAA